MARNCGMVRPNDKVVIVNGHPPDKENPAARIEWELAEAAEDPELVDEEETPAPDEVGTVEGGVCGCVWSEDMGKSGGCVCLFGVKTWASQGGCVCLFGVKTWASQGGCVCVFGQVSLE